MITQFSYLKISERFKLVGTTGDGLWVKSGDDGALPVDSENEPAHSRFFVPLDMSALVTLDAQTRRASHEACPPLFDLTGRK